jgi:DNA invertase Pin-like site-specific DNA recombinase
MALYGYVRVSTVEQATGTSLAEQQRRIEGVALMRGEPLARTFEEPGVSGSVPLEARPAGRELLGSLNPGDVVVASSTAPSVTPLTPSRRPTRGNAGIKLIVADMGAEPVTDNAVAKMFFGMLALVAEFERERILERTVEAGGRRQRRVGTWAARRPSATRSRVEARKRAW